MSHPSQTPDPQDPNTKDFGPTRAYFGPPNTPPPGGGYGYGGQPLHPETGQPYPPQAWMGGYQGHPDYGQRAQNSNGLAIASLILGIVGLALAWIPIINYVAMVLGLIALVLGGIGIFKSHRMMSIAGGVLGLVAIVASFAVYAAFVNSVNTAVEEYNGAVAEAPSSDEVIVTPAPGYEAPYVPEAEGEGYPAPGNEVTADELYTLDNAKDTAGNYLEYMHMSRTGLINQLEFDGFASDDAVTAVDSLGANWNEQAALQAQWYTQYTEWNGAHLRDQLEWDGFTTEQAKYGVEQAGL